jgi:hypothetical protein
MADSMPRNLHCTAWYSDSFEENNMSNSVADQMATMEANILAKTGQPVSHWVKLAKAQKLEKHGMIVKYLKTEHGITHGYANLIAHEALQSAATHQAEDDLVAAQYAGEKASLKPIYDQLMKAVEKFGSDVEVAPKKTYVSLRRKKQFALIQPSTKTRLDVGINLKGKPATGRLEASGSFNAMVSHRVKLETAADANAEVIAWLKEAYEAAS